MINLSVYPDVYKKDFTQGSGANAQNFSIPFTYNIREALERNLYDSENPFDSSNVYTVYNNTVENTIGEYTLLQWPERDNFRHFKTEVKKTAGKKNLRMFFGCQQGQNPVCFRDVFTWGDLGRYQNAYKESELTMTSSIVSCNYDGLDIFTRNNRNYSLISSASIAGSIFTLNPITKINVNALILMPYFHINTRRIYGYNSETGMYANISSITDVSRSWSDIKPADNTPQGQYYDDDLYKYGYKVTYGEDEIVLQWIDCVRIIPYYGITDTVYNSDTDTFSGNTKGNRIDFCNRQNALDDSPILSYNQYSRNLRYQIFTILTEELNEDTGNIIYSSIPGVIFSDLNSSTTGDFGLTESITINSSGAQITQASGFTPLTQYYGNRTYSGIYGKTEIGGNPTVIVPCVNVQNEYTPLSTGFTYDGSGHFINAQSATRYQVALNGYFSIKKLWSTIAAMGFFVADSQVCAQSVNLSDFNCNRLYIGEMLTNGETTGNMLQGQNIANSLQPTIDDIINDTPVTPVNPLHPPSTDGIETNPENTGENLPDFTSIRRVSGNAFTTFYDIPLVGIEEMGFLLSQVNEDFWTAIGTVTDSKMSNILDYIVSLKWYPCDFADGKAGNVIQFGFDGNGGLQMSSGVTVQKLNYTYQYFDMGSVNVPSYFANKTFLDYEPFTSCKLYMPYVGIADVPSNLIVGYTINFNYIVDLTTGMCTVICDNGHQVIYTGTGKIGVDITVSGNDIVTQSEKLAGAQLQSKQNLINGIAGFVTSSAGAAMGNVSSAFAAATTIANTGIQIATDSINIADSKRAVPQTVGSGSGFGSSYNPQKPCVIIERKCIQIPSGYGHNTGYILNRFVNLSSLSGFTVCDNPDISGIPADSAELKEIFSLLTSGIYL